ncbi:MAG: hypothetical protein RLY97_932 [Pseudomonadota bacterium]
MGLAWCYGPLIGVVGAVHIAANDFEPAPVDQGNGLGQAQGQIALQKSADPRGSSRYTLLLRSAKLIADGREYLCILRDASSGGVKLRLFHPLPPSKFLALELGGGERYPVQCVWQKGDFVGLSFHGSVNVQSLIEENFAKYPRRPLRVNLHKTARMRVNHEDMHVTLVNLSQQGACIDCDAHLLLQQRLRIDIAHHVTLFAKVSWRRYPHYGLVLEQTFSLSDLAILAAQLQGL